MLAAALGVKVAELLSETRGSGPRVRGGSVPVVNKSVGRGVWPTQLRDACTVVFDGADLPVVFADAAAYCARFERPVEIVSLHVAQTAPPGTSCELVLTWMPWRGGGLDPFGG